MVKFTGSNGKVLHRQRVRKCDERIRSLRKMSIEIDGFSHYNGSESFEMRLLRVQMPEEKIKWGDCMELAEEIKFYCETADPAGALLLTGEWGCGKTFFIENQLRAYLGRDLILLRISLFGMTDASAVHDAVRDQWMYAYYRAKGFADEREALKSLKAMACSAKDLVPERIKKVLQIDPEDFITMQNRIAEKPVILIFDDLERCQMELCDLLGIINDYCENRKFHTIIVANQEIIRRGNAENRANLAYDEIKEKIIQRTIHYTPDYERVVEAVIRATDCSDEGYLEFLKKFEPGILDLFAPDRDWTCLRRFSIGISDLFVPDSPENATDDSNETVRPHNIRSLKCALNDFHRIYQILVEKKISHVENWLFSFVSFVISYRANYVNDTQKSTYLPDVEVSKLFPAYQAKYMPDGIQQWILAGIWDESRITEEIQTIRQQEQGKTPAEIIRISRIEEIDEDVLVAGFQDYLDDAYSGNLSLREYLLLIENSATARTNSYELPVEIAWDKIQIGVCKALGKVRSTLSEEDTHLTPNPEAEKYEDMEQLLYEVIMEFSRSEQVTFLKMKKTYLEQIQNSLQAGIMSVQNKRLVRFDIDMAVETRKAFLRSHNDEKFVFIQQFPELLMSMVKSSTAFDLSDTKRGIEKLQADLNESLQQRKDQKRDFAVIHTQSFVQRLTELIPQLEKKYESMQKMYLPRSEASLTDHCRE